MPMNDAQLTAWLTRGHRALQETFPPRTQKSFAALMLDSGLWSSKRLSLDSAIARVGDCLHPERGGGQSFKVSEIWLWMKDSGHHAFFEAMADDLGYRVEPIPTEQRQQELLTRIDERLAAVVDELSDLHLLRDQLTGAVTNGTAPLTPASPVRFSQYPTDERAF